MLTYNNFVLVLQTCSNGCENRESSYEALLSESILSSTKEEDLLLSKDFDLKSEPNLNLFFFFNKGKTQVNRSVLCGEDKLNAE